MTLEFKSSYIKAIRERYFKATKKENSVNKPGSFQADTVAHCGNSLSGTFIWTLTVTDEFTGWTENKAMYSKTAHSTTTAMTSIL